MADNVIDISQRLLEGGIARLSFLAPRPMKLDAEEAQKWALERLAGCLPIIAQEPRPPEPPEPPMPPMPPMPWPPMPPSTLAYQFIARALKRRK